MKKENAIWTFLGIVFFAAVIYLLVKNSDFISGILYKSGALAPIVAVILYPLLAPTPLTTDLITVIVGVTYGPFLGAVIAFIGNTLAALVEYFIGIRLGKATNFEKNKKKIPFGLGKLPVNSIAFLIVGRMVPGYGGKIISIMAGTYKVPIKRYLWTTAVTNLLGSLILAYGAAGFINAIKFSKLFGN